VRASSGDGFSGKTAIRSMMETQMLFKYL
jgi:hypothetical protein